MTYSLLTRQGLLTTLLCSALAAGCSSGTEEDVDNKPAPKRDGSTSSAPRDGGASMPGMNVVEHMVDLSLSGSVMATLRGKGGLCASEGTGAKFSVRSGQFNVDPPLTLEVTILNEASWDTPSVILNVQTSPSTSYLWDGKAGKVTAKRDRSEVTFTDVEMAGIGNMGKVTVKGTLRCSQ
jgi:hypothetical protein